MLMIIPNIQNVQFPQISIFPKIQEFSEFQNFKIWKISKFQIPGFFRPAGWLAFYNTPNLGLNLYSNITIPITIPINIIPALKDSIIVRGLLTRTGGVLITRTGTNKAYGVAISAYGGGCILAYGVKSPKMMVARVLHCCCFVVAPVLVLVFVVVFRCCCSHVWRIAF